ncbi:MAG: hypothetical protein AABZ14_03790, partial [Candidatus Margulisiibacteriota bacterium]
GRRPDTLTHQIALNFSRSFNWERADRIGLSYEIYYNGNGYQENILTDTVAKSLLLNNNLYQTNQLSSLYQAFFVTIGEFPDRSNQTLLSGIWNAIDRSAILSLSVSQAITDGFSMSASAVGFLGSDDTEYLLQGNTVQLQLGGQLAF